ncbi:hypothetical protein KHC23_08745 [Ancylobacter dichloromethanicus]|uniref:Uncharacterized protein n=1 Tax=Ancylobacter dichloromethanicus TaxID=518825 RepID=A0A9W6MYA3_9HYPH|nr:hypothetical protein [Ancylobacter dichloromethanicus]MBS7553737.1 hypothetical protein [Ancylobacter dichloromethanicus]GLK70841.1 hypothetical protein GCM10017643_09560 [Ancylobacter dichloromethanicus]
MKETVEAAVQKAIRDLIKQEMGRFDVEDVAVDVAPDHDGDPSLRITVTYGDRGEPVDTRVMSGLVSKLRDELWRLGEERFPYIQHHFRSEPKVVGFR